MTQRMPRNQLLHERRHKRKAGPHGRARKPDPDPDIEAQILLTEEIVDELIEEERLEKERG